MASNRAELFAAEKKRLEEEQKQKENRGNWTPPEYEEIPYSALETNELRVFRFIGDPVAVRTENWHPKSILSSRITNDKKGFFICHWSEDRDWFLWKLYNKLTAYDWDPNFLNPDGKKGRKVYKLASSNQKILDRVLHNGKEPVLYKGKKIEDSGWRPSVSILMNVIDRANYQWHKDNKSFSLISKKSSAWTNDKGEEKVSYEPGIPLSTYEFILKAIVEEKGALEDFDLAIRKIEKDPWYEVYSFFDQRKISDDLKTQMNGDPLTEEETSWKKIDIDKITKVTSYRKIQNNLGDFIKLVDSELNTGFYSELSELVAKEKAEWDAKKKDEEKDAIDELNNEQKPEGVKKQTRTRESVVETKTNDVFQKMKDAGWKAVDKFKEELGDAVKDVEFGKSNEETFIVIEIDGEKVNKEDMIPCCDCNLPGPSFINFCPACGAEFK